MVTPDGKLPVASDQVGEPMAPLTPGVIPNRMPTCAGGAAGIVTTNGGGSMVIEKVAVARLAGHPGSKASTTRRPVCTCDGVPLTSAAAASNARPAGSELPPICQAHGPEPPAHVSVCAYD
jgi:hypothetical protein